MYVEEKDIVNAAWKVLLLMDCVLMHYILELQFP